MFDTSTVCSESSNGAIEHKTRVRKESINCASADEGICGEVEIIVQI
jgi:hypothetical protein